MEASDDRLEAKRRECLRCSKMFKSYSAANRICAVCTAKNKQQSGIRVVQPQGYFDNSYTEDTE
jgi:recombinational DNA repair protein RecR